MIGVIANFAAHDVVREFFELFKTPWEFYREGRQYDVVLVAGDEGLETRARCVLVYGGPAAESSSRGKQVFAVSQHGERIPIYRGAVSLPQNGTVLLTDEVSGQCLAYRECSGDRVTARIGYDLFAEVRMLLTEGQPPENAAIPALDLHIAFLRDLIASCGIPLVEIPPVPEGYRFIACLTHDVDHPSIRRHKFDHTTLGFLYRAIIGSLRDLIGGRMTVRGLFKNWAAAMKLPFVHLGLAKDFWGEFGDQYRKLEDGAPSTFFVIPFENCPGKNSQGSAPPFRAARYGARDIANTIQKLGTAGCEVGLHGIDAWIDSSKGSEELAEIRRLTGNAEVGVRMHWLYFDEHSPATLERAGAAYDSTFGYNQTVGYRAGTTQAYKPLNADWLLELPLHAMDTALFYPAYLGLAPDQASKLLGGMVSHAAQSGGCLTINWHDRSLAPERLWDGCYRELLQELKARGAWFATAGEAVSWFRKRRSTVFALRGTEPDALCARVAADPDGHLPGLRLRVNKSSRISGSEDYADMTINEKDDTRLPQGAVC